MLNSMIASSYGRQFKYNNPNRTCKTLICQDRIKYRYGVLRAVGISDKRASFPIIKDISDTIKYTVWKVEIHSLESGNTAILCDLLCRDTQLGLFTSFNYGGTWNL